MTAREAALDQLDRIETRGSYVGFFTKAEKARLDPRERRQATEYVAGVTRWRRRLDFILAHFCRSDYSKMEASLKQVLRLGLYELLFTQTPPHAAVNEAVNLAKRRVRKGAGGLANGVLRAIEERAPDDLPAPDSNDVADDLAIQHSHPTWMVRRWLDRFGHDETEALLNWNNARPTYHIRINTLEDTSQHVWDDLHPLDLKAEHSPYLDDFIRVSRLQPLLERGWLKEGRCVVQDESAGLVVRVLDPKPGEAVLDGCAAPGGKAFYMSALMQNEGRIIANDIHGGKLRKLKKTAGRLGAMIVATREADLRALNGDSQNAFDAVLLDAPCSGLGVLAKRADLRWRRSPEDLDELTHLQDGLLDAAAKFVKPGGRLVYSTCTIEPEENGERVQAFLTKHPDFELESAAPYVPAQMVAGGGFFASLPQRDGIDGAFTARLGRR